MVLTAGVLFCPEVFTVPPVVRSIHQFQKSSTICGMGGAPMGFDVSMVTAYEARGYS